MSDNIDKDTGRDGPEPRRRVWPKALLAVSLTLNVLVLAVIAGAHVRDGRDGRFPPPTSPDRSLLRDGGFMPFFDAMPHDARERMAEALRTQGGGVKPDRAALAADFRDFVAALRAEPFAPGAVSEVLETQHQRIEERVVAGRTLLLDQIVAMTPEERIAFADALEARFRDALRRVGGKPDGDRRPND
ncbi:MAG: periplasmic heavy metal sensor [Maritimibacter sp.]|nr:periplasmic heavy metal sensor [Maritimibacter sp.]